MTIAFEFIQWGLLLLVGAATAVNALVLYRIRVKVKLTASLADLSLANTMRQIELNKPSHPGSPLHD